MPRYAVSHIDWFDHDLVTVIVKAIGWAEALQQHPKIGSLDFEYTTLENVKKQAFDVDAMVECVEVPEATQ